MAVPDASSDVPRVAAAHYFAPTALDEATPAPAEAALAPAQAALAPDALPSEVRRASSFKNALKGIQRSFSFRKNRQTRKGDDARDDVLAQVGTFAQNELRQLQQSLSFGNRPREAQAAEPDDMLAQVGALAQNGLRKLQRSLSFANRTREPRAAESDGVLAQVGTFAQNGLRQLQRSLSFGNRPAQPQAAEPNEVFAQVGALAEDGLQKVKRSLSFGDRPRKQQRASDGSTSVSPSSRSPARPLRRSLSFEQVAYADVDDYYERRFVMNAVMRRLGVYSHQQEELIASAASAESKVFYRNLEPLASSDAEYNGPAIKSIQKRRTREHVNRAYEALHDQVSNRGLKVDIRFSRRGRMRAKANVRMPLPDAAPLDERHKAAFLVIFVDPTMARMTMYASEEEVGQFGGDLVAD